MSRASETVLWTRKAAVVHAAAVPPDTAGSTLTSSARNRPIGRAYRGISCSQNLSLHCAAAGQRSPYYSSDGTRNSLFIFGFGYVALGLARMLRDSGWCVSGTCRGRGRQTELEAQGFTSFLFDTDRLSLGLGRQGIQALRQATHVLVAISPSSSCETSPIAWILGREGRQMRENLEWIGFLSTTSVYGDHKGAWVTEESEVRATEGSGLERKQAETAWLQLHAATGMPIHIFRLAGIYGPGRSALEAASKPALGNKRSGKRFTSRCHVYDICQGLLASMAAPAPGEVYNIADDDPTSREEVLQFVRDTFGSTLPPAGESRSLAESTSITEDCTLPIEASTESPPAPPRRGGEKRVRNHKLKEALGVKLKFPTFREGLEAIHSGNLLPFK